VIRPRAAAPATTYRVTIADIDPTLLPSPATLTDAGCVVRLVGVGYADVTFFVGGTEAELAAGVAWTDIELAGLPAPVGVALTAF
jgi:hypothetical protein